MTDFLMRLLYGPPPARLLPERVVTVAPGDALWAATFDAKCKQQLSANDGRRP